MRYYSIFSGVEAATLAWEPLGWEPVVFCEVDEFPSAVLRERWPDVPNLGDITKVNWKRVVREYGAADLVVGGSPCQSFSVAGTRTGLDGASGLMWEYVRCVREVKPRWVLWENVPGALSSSHGEDFRCLLEALDALGYGLAWRVLDAQFFGVAQRRERVFLVGCLGDPRPPAEVLFEPEGLRWDTPSSREKRKELAAGAGGGAACAGFKWHQGSGAGSIGLEDEQSPTLTVDYHNPAVIQLKGNSIDRDTSQNGRTWCDPDENGTYTLNATDIDGVVCMTDTQPHSMVDGEVCGALSATMHKDPPVVAKTLKMRGGCDGGGKGPLVQNDMSATLGTGNDQTLFEPVSFSANQRVELRLQGGDGTVVGAVPASQSGKQVQGVLCQYGDVAGAITARNDGSPCPDRGPSVVAQGYVVRRLTPRECERLQGFPEWIEIEVDDTTPSDEVAAIALANGDIIVDFDTGKVYGTRGPGGMKLENPRELGTKHPSGYIHIHLSAGGQKRQVRAHRIVWMAANGAIPDGMVIDHINNVKSDNRLSNLQLMTPEDNSHKAKDDGLYLSGDASPTCKLTADVRTRLIYDRMAYGMTYSELAQKYGVTRSHACQIVKASDHTKIPYRGKTADECPDTPRYKAIGNSMAVPVMRWIGERIGSVDATLPWPDVP